MIMKNADMPAMPVLNGDNEPANIGSGYYRDKNLATGLTKREAMFMHVIGSVFAATLHPAWETMGYRYQEDEEIVKRAISLVDIGLAELEKQNDQ